MRFLPYFLLVGLLSGWAGAQKSTIEASTATTDPDTVTVTVPRALLTPWSRSQCRVTIPVNAPAAALPACVVEIEKPAPPASAPLIAVDSFSRLIGTGMVLLGILPLWWFSYWRFLPRRMRETETIYPNGNRSYSYITLNENKNAEAWRIGHWVVLLGIALVFLVMFK